MSKNQNGIENYNKYAAQRISGGSWAGFTAALCRMVENITGNKTNENTSRNKKGGQISDANDAQQRKRREVMVDNPPQKSQRQ